MHVSIRTSSQPFDQEPDVQITFEVPLALLFVVLVGKGGEEGGAAAEGIFFFFPFPFPSAASKGHSGLQ